MAAASAPITQWSPNKKYSEAERLIGLLAAKAQLLTDCFLRWICIYPAYINSKKSRQEGRRLPKENCIENPTFQEIKDVLSVCNVRFGVENKLYPREKSKVMSSHQTIIFMLNNRVNNISISRNCYIVAEFAFNFEMMTEHHSIHNFQLERV